MKKIQITNFGPIVEAEVEIKNLVVFIGQQASGKSTISKCDFIVLNNDKFCFVELKTNAESEEGVSRNLKKARKQLGAIINYFDDNNVDFLDHEIEAYIVLKNRLYPNDNAGKKALRKSFFDKYKVDLFEENTTEF
jgi:predicted ATPase